MKSALTLIVESTEGLDELDESQIIFQAKVIRVFTAQNRYLGRESILDELMWG